MLRFWAQNNGETDDFEIIGFEGFSDSNWSTTLVIKTPYNYLKM